MGAILGLIFVGIAILLILCFFAMNRWSSPEHDREGGAALRANRRCPDRSLELAGLVSTERNLTILKSKPGLAYSISAFRHSAADATSRPNGRYRQGSCSAASTRVPR